MIWIILTFVFGWLLCAAWAMRMDEKDLGEVEKDIWFYYVLGLIALLVVWLDVWFPRLREFMTGIVKGIKLAYKEAKK